MSETYKFPDEDDVPTIECETDDPYEMPETKKLFISYDSDEWDDENDVQKTLETINWLFGTDVQVVLIPNDFDLLSTEEVREVLDLEEAT